MLVTCKMSLCRCNVCISAAFRDGTPALFVYSAILSFIPVSCRGRKKNQHRNKTNLKWFILVGNVQMYKVKELSLISDAHLQKCFSITHAITF